MFDHAIAGTTAPEDLTSGDLLRAARDEQRAAWAAEARLLALAYQWAVAHPVLDGGREAEFHHGPGIDSTPIAGRGCPTTDEHAVAELGAVLSMSTAAAKRLVGEAVELHHRLPRLLGLVRSGRLPAWRARAVAAATIHADPALSPEAAAWIDAQAAAVAGRVGKAQLDRLLDDAIRRHHLDDHDAGELEHDSRGVWIDRDHISFRRTLHVDAELDVPDALDLDHALRTGAAELKALGSTEGLDARRAAALGHLARHQLALALHHGSDLLGLEAHSADAGAVVEQRGTSVSTPLPPARRLELHVRLSAVAGPDGLTLAPTGVLDQGQLLILSEQVRRWAADAFTEVRVLPILDLARPLTSPGYVPGPRLRRHVEARDLTCVFPWCTRPARSCDLDHVAAYDAGGATTSANLASLCRAHHRLKTHTVWSYRADPDHPPGTWLWTSPHGHRFRRERDGTTALSDTGPPGRLIPRPRPAP